MVGGQGNWQRQRIPEREKKRKRGERETETEGQVDRHINTHTHTHTHTHIHTHTEADGAEFFLIWGGKGSSDTGTAHTKHFMAGIESAQALVLK